MTNRPSALSDQREIVAAGDRRRAALRAALLQLGATPAADRGNTLTLGEVQIALGDSELAIRTEQSAPELIGRIADLARLFRITVASGLGAPVAPLRRREPACTESPQPIRRARRHHLTVVDELLDTVPDLARSSPTTARIAHPALRGEVVERDHIVTVAFIGEPPQEADRLLLGLVLARICAQLDARDTWGCVMFDVRCEPWLDRTLRNLFFCSDENPRAYLRAPRKR
jgi:hypothetical protein